MGDLLLKELGIALTRNIRREDTAARMGGDEFVNILPGILPDPARGFGERLRKVIEQDNLSTRSTTVSLGRPRMNSHRGELR